MKRVKKQSLATKKGNDKLGNAVIARMIAEKNSVPLHNTMVLLVGPYCLLPYTPR
jgi:hypothetical protein